MSTNNVLTEALEEIDSITDNQKNLDQMAPSLEEVEMFSTSEDSEKQPSTQSLNEEEIASLENDNLFFNKTEEILKDSTEILYPAEGNIVKTINENLNKENQQEKRIKKNNLNSNPSNEILQNSHNILKIYSKSDSTTKKMIRDLIKLALMSNGIFLEKPSGCEDVNFSQLNLSLRDGDILNLRLENLILTKESTQITKEMILSAAKNAESVSQVLQKLQKSPINKNLRFKVENILANNQIILPP